MFIVTDGKRIVWAKTEADALRVYGEIVRAGGEARLFFSRPIPLKAKGGVFVMDASEGSFERLTVPKALETVGFESPPKFFHQPS